MHVMVIKYYCCEYLFYFSLISFSVVESFTAATSGLLSPSGCQRRLSVSAEKVHASAKRQHLLKSMQATCNSQLVLAILK